MLQKLDDKELIFYVYQLNSLAWHQCPVRVIRILSVLYLSTSKRNKIQAQENERLTGVKTKHLRLQVKPGNPYG